jgi:hypothetical protein
VKIQGPNIVRKTTFKDAFLKVVKWPFGWWAKIVDSAVRLSILIPNIERHRDYDRIYPSIRRRSVVGGLKFKPNLVRAFGYLFARDLAVFEYLLRASLSRRSLLRLLALTLCSSPGIQPKIAEDQQRIASNYRPLSKSHLDTFLSKPHNARCEIRKFCENRNFRFYIKPRTFNNLELAQWLPIQAVKEFSVESVRVLKITRTANREVVFTVSGRLDAENLGELKTVMNSEANSRRIALDLKDLTLVDQDAVSFLERCEADNITLKNCPAYIREWITGERKTRGRNT